MKKTGFGKEVIRIDRNFYGLPHTEILFPDLDENTQRITHEVIVDALFEYFENQPIKKLLCATYGNCRAKFDSLGVKVGLKLDSSQKLVVSNALYNEINPAGRTLSAVQSNQVSHAVLVDAVQVMKQKSINSFEIKVKMLPGGARNIARWPVIDKEYLKVPTVCLGAATNVKISPKTPIDKGLVQCGEIGAPDTLVPENIDKHLDFCSKVIAKSVSELVR